MTGSAFLSRLGIRLPIVQAPMAGISTPALAAAVSNAGGLGSLGIAAMSPEQAGATITETGRLTGAPFGVNVFCHAPARRDPKLEEEWLRYLSPSFKAFGEEPPSHLQLLYKSFHEDNEMLSVLLDLRPAVVSFHFGLPTPEQIRALKEAGIVLLATATNLHEAHQISAAQLDGIVAQGIEAGGHRGMFDPGNRDEGPGTMALTRILVRNSSLPVIAAGGIMDGAGIAAALSLGADAAQLGTAFVACPESAADAAYREALLAGASARTVMTQAISGRPARGLANRFTELGEAPSCPRMPDYPLPYFAGKALHALAKRNGDSSFAAQWAGQGVSMTRAMPASELMSTLSGELDAATHR
ncbi:NAD(P)H-dependent flavin oxidoreductase [Paracidobacterium acidisoli]|uniref:Nitronate monooxygenase n=1 Tax=Paracidobacterium acidisoli TaxID=2303751 RepID=A0A372IJT2_9BACT|nr:nitronate monooxygenase [Paracidobacterium acidisoli]MBT9333112.1 nitronate monooxygenase [Paracidobacterium acidisoli]